MRLVKAVVFLMICSVAVFGQSNKGGINYFHIPIPEGFATTNPNAFDITTLQGVKLYRLRQIYDTNFGALNAAFSQPRYVQFGIRIFF
jgi:hypothetical protein